MFAAATARGRRRTTLNYRAQQKLALMA